MASNDRITSMSTFSSRSSWATHSRGRRRYSTEEDDQHVDLGLSNSEQEAGGWKMMERPQRQSYRRETESPSSASNRHMNGWVSNSRIHREKQNSRHLSNACKEKVRSMYSHAQRINRETSMERQSSWFDEQDWHQGVESRDDYQYPATKWDRVVARARFGGRDESPSEEVSVMDEMLSIMSEGDETTFSEFIGRKPPKDHRFVVLPLSSGRDSESVCVSEGNPQVRPQRASSGYCSSLGYCGPKEEVDPRLLRIGDSTLSWDDLRMSALHTGPIGGCGTLCHDDY